MRSDEQLAPTLLRLNPRTLRLEGIPTRLTGVAHLAATPGGVYARTSAGIFRYRNGRLIHVKTAFVPHRAMLSLYGTPGLGRAWVTVPSFPEDGTDQVHAVVVAYDPGVSRPQTVHLGASPFRDDNDFAASNGPPVVAAGAVWVSQTTGRDPSVAWLQPIRPTGGPAGRPVRIGGAGADVMVVGAGRIWVIAARNESRSELLQFDPRARRVVGKPFLLPRGFYPSSAVYARGTIWIADLNPYGHLIRIAVGS